MALGQWLRKWRVSVLCCHWQITLQWGTNRTNGTYPFPIPFTAALCCFGNGEAGSGYNDKASADSNTHVRVHSDGSSRFVSWIAIGA